MKQVTGLGFEPVFRDLTLILSTKLCSFTSYFTKPFPSISQLSVQHIAIGQYLLHKKCRLPDLKTDLLYS